MRRLANFLFASETNNYHPPVLSYKAFLIYGLCLLILRLFLGAAVAEGAVVDSKTLMGLINKEREARNIVTLFTDERLTTAAMQKTQDMFARDYFAHVDPDGDYVWPKITSAGYAPYRVLGENLAINFETSEGMIAAWLQSPKHRENLLNPDFVDQGLDAAYGDYQDRYTSLVTSLFGTLESPVGDGSTKSKASAPGSDEGDVQKPVPETRSATVKDLPERLALDKTVAPVELDEPPQNEPGSPRRAQDEKKQGGHLFFWARLFFTFFGVLMLLVLGIDSVIISRHNQLLGRGHSSYHFSSFLLIVLVSILVWWW